MLLFVNACLRDGSRTERLAQMWLERHAAGEDIKVVHLADLEVDPLDAKGKAPLADYNQSVAQGVYDHPMFDFAKEFARADEVLIAAPIWNYGIPAKLHAYLELVCSQGVTFDLNEAGDYVSLCQIDRLVFVSTAGGASVDPLDDHAFGYIRTLAERFWHVPHIEHVSAWSLDAPGANEDALLEAALA